MHIVKQHSKEFKMNNAQETFYNDVMDNNSFDEIQSMMILVDYSALEYYNITEDEYFEVVGRVYESLTEG